MTTAYSGRLELTWTNKHKSLLAHDDQSYEWVAQSDYRVSEIRVLHDVEKAGETASDANRAADNLLIRGDALHALNALTSIPEFARQYVGKVKLCYIDPPFNTGQAFKDYDDALEHSVWLTMLRDRCAQIKDLLSPDGTVWLHLDNFEVHRARCVLDEVFGASNFLASVVWQRTSAKSLARRTMGTLHETILVYGASERAELKALYRAMDGEYIKRRFTNADERGPYDTGDLTATSHRPHLDSGKPWGGFDPSELRRCWAPPRGPLSDAGLADDQIDTLTIRQKLDALDAAGFIHWPSGGGFPRFKKYLHSAKGRAIGDLWTDINVINSQAAERSSFSTQKPEALLQRVIEMATDPGDIVLDCFGGSGTTAATAHKMRRRWVTSEWSASTIAKYALPRLIKVVAGTDPGGITNIVVPTGEGLPEGMASGSAKSAAKALRVFADAGLFSELDHLDDELIAELAQKLSDAEKTATQILWSGGGGFRVLEVGPSMFEEVDGRVYLADWATNGALGEAVAAQFGYEYAPDGPFSGTKGKTRLAVVDGLVNEGVIRLLADQLPSAEKMLVCGTAIDPDCRAVLREIRPGSTMKKVPASILDDYRIRRRDRLVLASVLDWADGEAMIASDEAGQEHLPEGISH